MNQILLGFLLGLGAAVIDVVPMIIQRLPAAASASAFIQWIFLGIVITACDLRLPGWLTGLLIAVSGAIPVIIVVAGNKELVRAGDEAKTIAAMLIFSSVLGIAVGFLSRLFSR